MVAGIAELVLVLVGLVDVVDHRTVVAAVTDAVANPRDLAMDLVNAQQARRALDYLVGFNLSPLLWKKVRRGLSAGRVQSPALRMIVECEIEIEQFKAHVQIPYSFSHRSSIKMNYI